MTDSMDSIESIESSQSIEKPNTEEIGDGSSPCKNTLITTELCSCRRLIIGLSS